MGQREHSRVPRRIFGPHEDEGAQRKVRQARDGSCEGGNAGKGGGGGSV